MSEPHRYLGRLARWALACGLALGLGLVAGLRAGHAQRDLPPDIREVAPRIGTRLVFAGALPPGAETAQPGAVERSLHVHNAGWEPGAIVVVGLAGAGPAGCPAEPVVLGAWCVGALAPGRTRSLPIPPEGGARLVAYSLAAGEEAACGAAADLAGGRLALADFEGQGWAAQPGPGLAGHLEIAAPEGREASGGVASSGLLGRLRARAPEAYPIAAPYIPPEGRTWLVNAGEACATASLRSAPAEETGADCRRRIGREASVAAGSAVAVDSGSREPAAGLVEGPGELIGRVDEVSDAGWQGYDMPEYSLSEGSARLAFPLAIGPLRDQRSTLWVTNQHPTATTQVSLLMFDGNRVQHRIYNDPMPLCAGATRAYDIVDLAGEIPPTQGGRDGAPAGPPLLSLRVESLNADTPTAPPISAVLVLESAEGITALPGLVLPTELALAQRILAGSDRPGQGGPLRPLSVLPGVRTAGRDDPRATLLAIQVLNRNLQAERTAYVDLLGADGQPVAERIPVNLGVGPAGFLDLGNLPQRADASLPPGFVGTAVVYGQQGRGVLGVAALTRELAAGDAPPAPGPDRMSLALAAMLVRGPDPTVPTATPRPTFPPASPSPPAATATTPAQPARILLPIAHR